MHLISFEAAPQKVFAALTITEGIRACWTADADLDGEVGGAGELRFYGGGKLTRIRIDKLVPPRRVVWTVVDSFRPEWVGSTITFDLRPTESGTELLFAQRGYPKADENYAICTTGCGIYFSRLQQHLVAGHNGTDGT
jgi:uncharacterized protein YndB with AHSA1/START domain